MGGLQINENAQVMHIDGRPIEGLFAAGEVTGGVHGADRLASCATLDCLAFGRITGQSAAKIGKDSTMVEEEETHGTESSPAELIFA